MTAPTDAPTVSSELRVNHASRYPLFAHRALRCGLRFGANLPGVWRLRHRLLDISRTAFPDRPIKTRLRFGQSLWVLPNDLIGRNIFYNGLWESPIAAHFYNAIRPSDVVLDVGANIGQYAVLAGARTAGSGKVFAVEPNEAVAGFLARNVAENRLAPHVSVLRVAAWDSETTLFLDEGEHANCGTVEVSEVRTERHSRGVPARRLDTVLAERGCRKLDIVKLDIEGAELRALHGLTGILDQDPPRAVYCELLAGHGKGGSSEADLLKFFADRRYRPLIFTDSGLQTFDIGMVGDGVAATLLFQLT